MGQVANALTLWRNHGLCGNRGRSGYYSRRRARQEPSLFCKKFLVAGRVQGVFYRGTIARHALELAVTGYACNLPDGRVEVLACGPEVALAQLERCLWIGSSASKVTSVAAQDLTFDPAEWPQSFVAPADLSPPPEATNPCLTFIRACAAVLRWCFFAPEPLPMLWNHRALPPWCPLPIRWRSKRAWKSCAREAMRWMRLSRFKRRSAWLSRRAPASEAGRFSCTTMPRQVSFRR